MIGNVECATHGTRPETFVCEHILAAGKTGESLGFNYSAESDQAFPDAWCDACEAHLMANGGEWNEKTESFTKVVLLCSDCYADYRSNAARQGKERAH